MDSNSARKITANTAARPFLKWAGGKGALVNQLIDLMPDKYLRYLEPFVGAGALFFELAPKCALISDINSELITSYKVVRDSPELLIEQLGKHYYDKEYYYKIRELNPEKLSDIERAARMIFLNKTGFNGLYRVNRSGGFNVPFGRYTNPKICDEENILACSKLLKDCQIENIAFQDFDWGSITKDDFVYFDPPYVPLSKSSSFTSYTKLSFGIKEQEQLADIYRMLSKKGVRVLLSNSCTDLTRQLYNGFEQIELKVARAINSKAALRGAISELLIKNY